MRLYLCDQKIILRFYNQGSRFVRDYSTNITSAPRNAFINEKGRIVAVFDQRRVSDDEMWVVMERRFVGRLEKHLLKYLFISDTKMEPLEKLRVYWDLEGEAEGQEEDIFIPQKAGRLWLTASKAVSNVSAEEMTRFRTKNGIPWQGVDFDEEMILNIDEEDRISYLKGCYLGQEVVARVHYKGRPPKKITVKMLRDCPAEQRREMTSRVTDTASGEIVGFVFDKTSGE